VTIPLQHHFTVMRLSNLAVCLVSQAIPCKESITCLAPSGSDTFVAAGNKLYTFNRVRIISCTEVHDQPIIGLCLIGNFLISYDEQNLYVLNKRDLSELHHIKTLQPACITTITHPATYINKVIVGYSNGQLELWNIIRRKCIHTFVSATALIRDGRITATEQSPAVDVLAIGTSTGLVLLLHMKLDQVLFYFQQETTVTALSFRTDFLAEKFPYLASSTSDGRVHVWLLGGREGMERSLQETIEEAHSGSVLRAQFLNGEPLLLTAGDDNSMKLWIFDSPTGSCRLLRSREGHKGM
jgi:U3 small nucleolar RNA-associated protein 21